MNRLTTHNPNSTLPPAPAWGTQRSAAWWAALERDAKALEARLAYLAELDALQPVALGPVVQVPALPLEPVVLGTGPLVQLPALEDTDRRAQAQRWAALEAAADEIFGARR